MVESEDTSYQLKMLKVNQVLTSDKKNETYVLVESSHWPSDTAEDTTLHKIVY